MVRHCSAIGCKNRFARRELGAKVTFHRVPKAEHVQRKWTIAMRQDNNWTLKPHHSICSDHFAEKDIDRTGQTVRLREGAVPTIFPRVDEHLKKKRKQQRWEPVTSPNAIFLVDEAWDLQTSEMTAVNCTSRVNVACQTSVKTEQCGSQTYQSFAEESPREVALKAKLEATRQSLVSCRKKVKTLLQCRRRLGIKCAALHNTISDLTNKDLGSESGVDLFLQSLSLSEECQALLSRCIKSHAGMKKYSHQIPPKIKSFASKLHSYSPCAYTYVRKTFDCFLPHASTMRRWRSDSLMQCMNQVCAEGESVVSGELQCMNKDCVEGDCRVIGEPLHCENVGKSGISGEPMQCMDEVCSDGESGVSGESLQCMDEHCESGISGETLQCMDEVCPNGESGVSGELLQGMDKHCEPGVSGEPLQCMDKVCPDGESGVSGEPLQCMEEIFAEETGEEIFVFLITDDIAATE